MDDAIAQHDILDVVVLEPVELLHQEVYCRRPLLLRRRMRHQVGKDFDEKVIEGELVLLLLLQLRDRISDPRARSRHPRDDGAVAALVRRRVSNLLHGGPGGRRRLGWQRDRVRLERVAMTRRVAQSRRCAVACPSPLFGAGVSDPKHGRRRGASAGPPRADASASRFLTTIKWKQLAST